MNSVTDLERELVLVYAATLPHSVSFTADPAEVGEIRRLSSSEQRSAVSSGGADLTPLVVHELGLMDRS